MIFAAICIVIICLALAFFERFLANLAGHVPGLVLPVFFALTSLFSILSTVWQVLADLTRYGTPMEIILMFAGLFILLNIPTLVTYAMYVYCRRKKGETPWPCRPQNNTSSKEQPPKT